MKIKLLYQISTIGTSGPLARLCRWSAILVFLLFILTVNYVLPIDPDLGWHLRYGQEILSTGKVPLTDSFSHTFYGRPSLDVEWLAEVIFYLIYTRFSFFGLSIFSAFFTSLVFFVPFFLLRGNFEEKLYWFIWAVIGSYQVLAVGPRIQNFGLVFFSLLVVFILNYLEMRKIRYILPLPILFLFWVNTHPSFILGFLLLAAVLSVEVLFLTLDIIKERSFNISSRLLQITTVIILSLIFALSILTVKFKPSISTQGFSSDIVKGLALPATLASRSSVSGTVRTAIAEWLPPFFLDIPGTLFLLGMIFSLSVFLERPIRRPEFRYLVLLILFIYFSTLSRRNVPFFFLIFIPHMIRNGRFILRYFQKPPFFFINAVLVLSLFAWSLSAVYGKTKEILQSSNDWETYCRLLSYPCKAVEYIKRERPAGRMYNHYNWGGYLIWQLSEYPVFIDGRVPGTEIYSDYETVFLLKTDWQKILGKYDVSWILFPPNDIFQMVLEEENWKTVYKDKQAVILLKKQKE